MGDLARGGERNRQRGRRISRRSATSSQPVRNSRRARQVRLRAGGDRRQRRRSRSGRRRLEDRRCLWTVKPPTVNAEGKASRYATAPGVFRDVILIFLEGIEKSFRNKCFQPRASGKLPAGNSADGFGRGKPQESGRIRPLGAGRNSAHHGSTSVRPCRNAFFPVVSLSRQSAGTDGRVKMTPPQEENR